MMRKRYILPLAFVALLILLDQLLYTVCAAGFRRIEVGEHGGIVNRARKVRADVVVVGSSRAWHHYDSRVLEAAFGRSVYNAGCNGQSIPYARGIVDLLLRDYTPQMMFIEVDASPQPNALDHATVLAPFIDQSDAIRDVIYHRGPFEPLKYLSKSFRYNGKPLVILKNLGQVDTSPGGFRALDTIMPPPKAPPATLPRKRPDDPLIPYYRQLLADTIRQARQAGVQVVLVISPRWHYPGEIFETGAWAGDVPSTEKTPYLIFDGDPAFQDPSLFADLTHLNRHGAALFSRMLVEKVTALRLLPKDPAAQRLAISGKIN